MDDALEFVPWKDGTGRLKFGLVGSPTRSRRFKEWQRRHGARFQAAITEQRRRSESLAHDLAGTNNNPDLNDWLQSDGDTNERSNS